MKPLLIFLTLFVLAACSPAHALSQKPFLQVDRHDPLHNLHNPPAFNRKIEDVKSIQHLIQLIKQLPPFPDKPIHCPFDNGVNYDLTFKNVFNNNVLNVRAMGCRPVKYNHKVYWSMGPKGEKFRSALLKLLGLSEKEFTGRGK